MPRRHRSRRWCAACSLALPSAAPTPPMRWRLPSATPIPAAPGRPWLEATCRHEPAESGLRAPEPSGHRRTGMIGKLTGKLDGLLEGGCIFDVNGVGYLLSCSTKTLDRLRDVQGQAAMLVETQVRQDAIVLVGFGSAAERDTFRKLTSVQGVGT